MNNPRRGEVYSVLIADLRNFVSRKTGPCGCSCSGTEWLLALLSLSMLRTFPRLPRVNPEEIILL